MSPLQPPERRQDSQQLVRQWALLRLLSSANRAWSVKELAEQLRVTKSTIDRDLATLEQTFALVEEAAGKQKKLYRIDEKIRALETIAFGTTEEGHDPSRRWHIAGLAAGLITPRKARETGRSHGCRAGVARCRADETADLGGRAEAGSGGGDCDQPMESAGGASPLGSAGRRKLAPSRAWDFISR
jgi:hypothetical protein